MSEVPKEKFVITEIPAFGRGNIAGISLEKDIESGKLCRQKVQKAAAMIALGECMRGVTDQICDCFDNEHTLANTATTIDLTVVQTIILNQF